LSIEWHQIIFFFFFQIIWVAATKHSIDFEAIDTRCQECMVQQVTKVWTASITELISHNQNVESMEPASTLRLSDFQSHGAGSFDLETPLQVCFDLTAIQDEDNNNDTNASAVVFPVEFQDKTDSQSQKQTEPELFLDLQEVLIPMNDSQLTATAEYIHEGPTQLAVCESGITSSVARTTLAQEIENESEPEERNEDLQECPTYVGTTDEDATEGSTQPAVAALQDHAYIINSLLVEGAQELEMVPSNSGGPNEEDTLVEIGTKPEDTDDDTAPMGPAHSSASAEDLREVLAPSVVAELEECWLNWKNTHLLLPQNP
jgi:hypothetical protein